MKSFACLSLCTCTGQTSKYSLSLLRSHLNFYLSLTQHIYFHSSMFIPLEIKVGEEEMCMYLLSKQVTGQLSLSCFHSVRKTPPSCILPEIIPSLRVSKATAIFFPITMTQTSLKSMAFAQVKPRVKARASQVSSCKLRNALENTAQKRMRERMLLIWATSCCTSQIFNTEHHPDPNSGFGSSN